MSSKHRVSGRRHMLSLLLPVLLLAHVPAALSLTPVRFAVIGDRSSGHVPGIYGRIVREIERLKPDFVMTVGDMIEGGIEDSLTIEQLWADYLELVEPLSMPIHYAPGNNDIWSDLSERIYRRYAGEPYYSFTHEFLHFVILDNSRISNSTEFSKGQIEWLEADLKQHQDALYTLVFFHKPFWNESIVVDAPDLLHEIFVKYGVDAVFSGHYHQYFSGRYDEIIYTNMGSSGGGTTPSPSGLKYHYAWVTVDEAGIHIAPIHMGSVLPWDILTAEERKLCQRLEREGLTFKEPLPIDENRQSVDGRAVLVVNNSFLPRPVKQMIKWTIPAGWQVSPEMVEIDLPAGDEAAYTFKLSCAGPPYPVPAASLEFTYAENKSIPISAGVNLIRSADCMKFSSAIAIDGRVLEPSWKNPAAVLYHPQGGAATIDPVEFYFAYDEAHLYLAAVCHDGQIDSLIAQTTEQDSPVYLEDCVGYFIEPDPEEGAIYQIYINPLGTVYDQLIRWNKDGYAQSDRDWNGVYEIQTSIENSKWTVEISIPLEQWNVKAKRDDIWRVNFRRKQKRFNDAADWQVPIDYNPETFGKLIMRVAP
ncbi:MAG: metallophosphoesterase [Candidatus Eisenbacteria bacterium]|nr:metallophosphoesterase [Candidatus Eisenbacteria bacterium]